MKRVGSRLFWDCKLELNFVPVYRAVALGRRRTERSGDKLGFFVGLKEAQTAGSLISTYRVVSTTFKS